MNVRDVIVVGAGFGGLSAGALLAKRGLDVLLLESSNELGGCAGKFDRGGYRFAVGATLGMGFEAGGTLAELYQELGLPLPQMKLLPIIMDVHLPDLDIRYYQAKVRWYEELERQFPQEHQQMILFYEELIAVAEQFQKIIARKPMFPPVDWRGYKQVLGMANLENAKLMPYMLQTVQDRLKKYGLAEHRQFVAFLNGQLIDAVQTTVAGCPAFLGYIALNVFHRGAFYIYGGLATVAEDLAGSIRTHGGTVQLRSRVQQIAKRGDGWEVTTAKGQRYHAKQVVLNNSIHNLHGLFDADLGRKLRVREDEERSRPAWGAYALYLGCRDVFASEALFHQFIEQYEAPLTEGNQFLVSLSATDDRLRAAEGKRALTISTHTALDRWWERSRYDELKASYTERIMTSLERKFPQVRAAVDMSLPATPVTFQRYVLRERGKVGGYIPSGKFSWMSSYSPLSGLEGMWLCGDTVFPGAGTLGTALSGWIVADRISR
ncbi:C-3',4' desaturase CrtD [Tumebacillus sp. BK434]|uniref:phytoene desaturase family protein n=1 Tax=Tumebacillus sp. BK434 TaxID=2512169 RepID=UPI00104C0AC7|nr:NAD(P)/FAD-dependent oxidoreductase [Tumebacillus sp. BK434]TCP58118.1 C-3',4' desaturase CrtD [Tumebacillus sp. BK434]